MAKPIEIVQPGLIGAAGDPAGNGGVNVSIGQHDEPAAQRGDDLIFQAIRQIRRVHEAIRKPVQRVALLGVGDGLADRASSASSRCPSRRIPAPRAIA